MLPDELAEMYRPTALSQCTYRCVVLPDHFGGAGVEPDDESQCTYRCVVLPDGLAEKGRQKTPPVSMHLQVRGAP